MKINLTKLLKKMRECENAIWYELGETYNLVHVKFYPDGSGAIGTDIRELYVFDNWEELAMFADMPVAYLIKEKQS